MNDHIAAQATKDAAQDTALVSVDTKVDDHITKQTDKDATQDEEIVAAKQATSTVGAKLDDHIVSQEKMNTLSSNRMTAAEQELYSTTSRSISNSQRLDKVESRVTALESDLEGVKRSVATIAAISGLVQPRYVGDTMVSVGVGHAQGYEAVAIGITHNMSDHVGTRFAAAVDTQLEEVTASASVGFSF